jgi:SAM-dependent methyltransferase
VVAEGSRRREQRRYFFEPLLALAGGTLRGRRVLDAGCGDGYWSLQALEAGAEEVLGLDERGSALEGARRRLQQAGVEPGRWRLEQSPVPSARVEGSYDVALCIGLLERTGKPVELFELFAAAGAELVVVDTALSPAPASFFELSLEPAAGEPGEGVALLPTREAVVELTAEFGYDSVALAHEMGSYEGLGDYRAQRRVAFICATEIPLDELAWEEPPPVTPWWRTLLDPSLRGWQQPE